MPRYIEQKYWFLPKFIMDLANSIIIFVLRSLFATFESLKSLSNFRCMRWFQIRIQNIFIQMPRQFKLHCSYSYIAVTLQLCFVKNGEFKEKEIITF